MGQITLDYDNWDKTKDILLHRPGNTLGFTAILTSLEVGDMLTVRSRQRDILIREAGWNGCGSVDTVLRKFRVKSRHSSRIT